LPALIADPDVNVQIAACTVVEKFSDPYFKAPVLLTLHKAKDDWLIRTAVQAAYKLKAAEDAMQIIAARLDEPGMIPVLFEQLLNCIDHTGGWGSDGQASTADGGKMKGYWLMLLSQKREVISSGGKIKIGDPIVTADLFPPSFHFYFPDGNSWPDKGKAKPISAR
jgi:hypothetical protein